MCWVSNVAESLLQLYMKTKFHLVSCISAFWLEVKELPVQVIQIKMVPFL